MYLPGQQKVREHGSGALRKWQTKLRKIQIRKKEKKEKKKRNKGQKRSEEKRGKEKEENVICWKIKWNYKRGILTIQLKPFTNIFHDIKFDT